MGEKYRRNGLGVLFLFIVLGGSFLFGAFAVFSRRPFAGKAAMACGALLLLWIGVQLLFIGFVSWLQPAMALAAVVILSLAAHLAREGETA